MQFLQVLGWHVRRCCGGARGLGQEALVGYEPTADSLSRMRGVVVLCVLAAAAGQQPLEPLTKFRAAALPWTCA
jgi:hypothetical protein